MRRIWIVPALLGLVATIAMGMSLSEWMIDRATDPLDPIDGSAASAQEDRVLDAGRVAWAFVSQLPPDGGPGRYVLQAGFLGDAAPMIDAEVPWNVDSSVDLGRVPAVAAPARQAVVFVADDGARSVVRRAVIGEPGDEVLAETEHEVWDIAAAPDGSVAYLALVGRDEAGADLGVVRLALDGSGAIEPVLGPASAGAPPAIRRMAILPFSVAIDLAPDGRYLVRETCEAGVGCTSDAIDLATGATFDLGPQRPFDVGPDGMVLRERCGNVECRTEILSLATGASMLVGGTPFDTGFATVDGEPAVVSIEVDDAPVLVLRPVGTGDRRELHRSPDRSWLQLADRDGLLWEIPPGVVLVSEMTEGDPDEVGGAVVEQDAHYLLVPVDGGTAAEHAPPPIRHIGLDGVQG
jgi:hypothetical protein